MNTNRQTTRIDTNILYPELSYLITGVIFDIRNQYGPGQKEVIYQRLLEEKLKSKDLKVEREKRIDIYSQDSGKVIGIYRPDFLVEDKILIEVKSSNFTTKTDEKQLYYYLRNSSYELGLLVNFSTPSLYVKRIIYMNTQKPYITIRVNSCSDSRKLV